MRNIRNPYRTLERGAGLARVLATYVTMTLIVSLAVFLLQYLAPGDIEDVLIDKRSRPAPEQIEALREKYHLNEPVLVQYGYWLKDAIRFDFGESIISGQQVTDIIRSRGAITGQLLLIAFPIYLLLGLSVGVGSAYFKRSIIDRVSVAGSIILFSAPAFVSGLLLAYLFGYTLGWFPVFGAGEPGWSRWWHLVLPGVTAALASMGLLMKLTREAMSEQLQMDYVTFARARGINETSVVFRKALKNALIPVSAVAGNQLVGMITGIVLVETVFALPGLGALLVESVRQNDVPVVQGIAMVSCVFILTINALSDWWFKRIDIRIQGKTSG